MVSSNKELIKEKNYIRWCLLSTDSLDVGMKQLKSVIKCSGCGEDLNSVGVIIFAGNKKNMYFCFKCYECFNLSDDSFKEVSKYEE